MENDDWGFSAEELDSLEKNALKKFAGRQSSHASASSASVVSSPSPSPSPQKKRFSNKKLTIKIFKHSPGKIALETQYNERLLAVLKSVVGHEWDPIHRHWIYPESQLENLKMALSSVKDILSDVHVVSPLDFSPRSIKGEPWSENVAQPEGQYTVGSSVKSSWKGNAMEDVYIQKDEGTKDPSKYSVRLFLHASTNIAAKFDYNPKLVEAFHKIPRACWHAKERLWMFPASSLSTAEKILSEIDVVNVEVQRIDPLVQRALDAATAVSDMQGLYDRMPSFIESKLLPFQRDGVRFVLQHGGRALLADEMGLGKTLQAIAVVACIQESWPVLVLTPSSLRLHWACMIQQWMNIPSSDILVVLSQRGCSNRGGFKILYSNAKEAIRLDSVFNIISYDVVPKLQHVLLDSEFKIVIADESHFLKNAQAKRTIASLPVLQKAQYAILLTGTPALSRPIELYKQLEALYPDVYKSVHEYGNRYCKGGQFGIYQGASNHEELHNLMKATVMIRRLKKDVLSELPVKRRQQVFLDLDEKHMKKIRALFRELEMVKHNIKACKSEEEITALKFSEKQLINKIYNDSAEAKIPAVLDYLGTVIEADCKFLIFAHHQPMIDKISEFLIKKKVRFIRIDGRTPSSSRQALVSDFQEKDDIKAAVLSIKAGGVGLTLTAASTVIFAELSWTPGDVIQAEDRAHRIGQLSSVNIYYLLANDTVDDIIWDVVQSKLENLGQVLDGHERTLEVSVSQPKSSQGKQVLDGRIDAPELSVSQPKSSPGKQLTIDSFLKRCHGTDGGNDDSDYDKYKKHRN